jgi:hypothetical protein
MSAKASLAPPPGRAVATARCRLDRRRPGAAIPRSTAAGFLLSNRQGRRGSRPRSVMHNAYIIEIQDEAVGIAAREGRGFRFHAAAHAFQTLDGRLFSSLQQAHRAALAVQRAVGGGGARTGSGR